MNRRLTLILAAALAAVPAWVVVVAAWPEIVVPAYFVTRGGVLYDTIIFPHTPLLILTTALLAKLFGFSGPLFRAMISVSMACSGVLVAAGARRPRLGLFLGVPIYLFWMSRNDAVTLWPDPLMGPLVIAAALALERRAFSLAALLLGLCVMTKQTSAWLVLAALAYLLVARVPWRDVVRFVAVVSAPYALFAVVWAAIFRTTSHVYWTLIMLLSGHSEEIGVQFMGMTGIIATMFAIVPLYLLIERRVQLPLAWLAAGALGMAWPRFDVVHVAAAIPLLALITIRTIESVFDRLPRERHVLAGVAVAVMLLVVAFGQAFKPRIGSTVRFWSDSAIRYYEAEVRQRVPEGGAFLNFNTPWETLYVKTGTTTPSGIYVNPKFWYYLNKRGLDERLCRDLRVRHGTLVLFTLLDPRFEDPRTVTTCVCQTLLRTRRLQTVNRITTWRAIP